VYTIINKTASKAIINKTLNKAIYKGSQNNIQEKQLPLSIYLFLALLSFFFSANVNAQENTSEDRHKQCQKSEEQIVFSPNTIFDESKDDTYFFHRWANWLHITTKKATLENESAFFLKDCIHHEDDLAELERHLRTKKYLRDARVTFDKSTKKITATTWDNWSLLPTASFSRKGGVNSYSWGIKERNLLGLGIYAKLESYKNTQRSGYAIRANIPLFQKQNTDLYLTFADNDDGDKKSVFVQKIFAGFKTTYAYNIGFNQELRDDTIFQNGVDQTKFSHDISYKTASYSWLKSNDSNKTLRYKVGFTQNKETFSAFQPPVENLLSSALPHNRDFVYPWLGIDYVEKEFHKLTNIKLVNIIEDFNTGWQFDANIGIGNGNNDNGAWLFWSSNVNKGFSFADRSLMLLKLRFEGEIYKDQQTRVLAQIKSEYFHSFNEQWGVYFNNISTLSQNQYLDRPVNIGGNTGVRGFPLQYQHGEYSTQFTSEIRYYPNINIFKLFDLAGTAFADAGNAFGDTLVDNVENSWLYSVGIGARLYSPHSSREHQMIHIDLAFPVSDNPTIDSAAIRLQVKNSF